MTSVRADRLVEGCQSPRVHTGPPAVSHRAAEQALDFVESVGVFLDPWQRFAVREALAEGADGGWAAFEVLLLVARQNGKGEVMLALELAKLFLFRFGRPPLILHSAHLFPTAQEAFRRIRDVIDGSDVLRREVRRVSAAHGEEGIELTDGARLRFMARTTGGAGRGFSPTDLMLDEVFWLPLEAVSANLPALSAQRNPQIFYTSSTGFPTSEVLLSLVKRGRVGDGSLCYMDWSAHPDSDLDDPEGWLAANPAIGYRITETTIRRERAALPDAEFARERLGMWAEVGGGLIDTDLWGKLVDTSELGSPSVFAVDASLDGSVTVAGAGSGFVEVYGTHDGTSWVTDRCLELDRKFQPQVWVVDEGGAAAWLIRELLDAGLMVVPAKSAQVAAAAAQFVDAVARGSVRHGRDPGLDAAVAGCRARQFRDGGFFFGRRISSVDVAPLVAVTLAWWGYSVYGDGLGPDDVYVGF